MAEVGFIPGIGSGVDTAFDIIYFLDNQKGAIAGLIHPRLDGHLVKRETFATEVTDDEANQTGQKQPRAA